MAEVKVEKNQPSTAGERQTSGLLRRGEFWPARDLFSMSPFSVMRRLSEEMDRAFSTSLGLWGRGTESGTWAPAVEVTEKDGNLLVTAELPGLSKSDVKVECTNEGLIIQGERKREHEETRGGYHHTERSYGQFCRVIPLPEGAETEKAQAEFKDGILQVKIPVPESRSRHREIPIRT